MIIDHINNLKNYTSINNRFNTVIEYLKKNDIAQVPEGKHSISGEEVKVLIDNKPAKKMGSAKIETHKKYIDIQLVIAGLDNMGWKPAAHCMKPVAPYDPEKDIQFFEDAPDMFIPVNPGFFIIFTPDDAHMPMIGEGKIHKAVFKVLA